MVGATGVDVRLKSYQFRKERERTWRELDGLIIRVEERGVRGLTPYELASLPVLYRSAISSLSVARAISLDRNLLEYLETLVSRAYICVYSNKTPALDGFVRFVRVRFPRTVRRHFWAVLASLGMCLAGVLCAYVITARDLERYDAFVPISMQQGRGLSSTTEELRESLHGGGDETGAALTYFATFLFTHNAQVGILSFAFGFMACIPTAILIFYNGLILGAMTALYGSHGLGGEFLAWVLPHGVTEIGAICLLGAAGFVIGSSLLVPGRHTRLDALARNGREIGAMAMGAIVMLFFAAILEGFFRQWVQFDSIRVVVAAATTLFWFAYFILAGRQT